MRDKLKALILIVNRWRGLFCVSQASGAHSVWFKASVHVCCVVTHSSVGASRKYLHKIFCFHKLASVIRNFQFPSLHFNVSPTQILVAEFILLMLVGSFTEQKAATFINSSIGRKSIANEIVHRASTTPVRLKVCHTFCCCSSARTLLKTLRV